MNPGDLIAGRFRLGRPLRGRPGCFEAVDRRYGVAVTVREVELPPGSAAAEALVVAVRTVGSTGHRQLVEVRDTVLEDGRAWLVTPAVYARTLQTHLDGHGPLPAADVARIGSRLAGGLAAAHATGTAWGPIDLSTVVAENLTGTIRLDYAPRPAELDRTAAADVADLAATLRAAAGPHVEPESPLDAVLARMALPDASARLTASQAVVLLADVATTTAPRRTPATTRTPSVPAASARPRWLVVAGILFLVALGLLALFLVLGVVLGVDLSY